MALKGVNKGKTVAKGNKYIVKVSTSKRYPGMSFKNKETGDFIVGWVPSGDALKDIKGTGSNYPEWTDGFVEYWCKYLGVDPETGIHYA